MPVKERAVAASTAPLTQRARVHRTEIEGLRAVAALLVAAWHIWIGGVSGGVDVFFVVSGMLITTTLLGHLDRYGRVRPLAFLGRLARRLLPSALVVLAAAWAMTWLSVPEALRGRSFREILASALYSENWQLAFAAVDYLDRDDPHSPVQHFWAMSVQGQLYVLWAVAFLLASGIGLLVRRRTRAVVAAVIATITAVSFAYSVWFTAINQPFAYFSTFTRAWEFGVGALLAFVIVRIRLPRALAFVFGWLGLAALLLCGALLPVATSFPGYVALWPVTAAVLVLSSGTERATRGHAAWLLSRRPLVWLGGISYGIYLWHWPLLVVVRHVTGRDETDGPTGIGIISASVVLSWLTTRLVEAPLRRLFERTAPLRRAGTTILLTGALVVAGAGFGAGAWDAQRAEERQAETAALLESDVDCFGASAALAAPGSCENDPERLVPAVSGLLEDTGGAYSCYTPAGAAEPVTCTLGSEEPDALRVALVGNSHAAMMIPALRELLVEHNWRLDTYTGNGCVWGMPASGDVCAARQARVEEALSTGEPYDVLLATTGSAGEQPDAESVASVRAAWDRVAARGTRVVVIADNPRLPEDTADCVRSSDAEALASGRCTFTAEEGYAIADVFAEAAADESVPIVDLSDLYCRDGDCPTVTGNVIMYRDRHHLTATYARSLGPILVERIGSALAAE